MNEYIEKLKKYLMEAKPTIRCDREQSAVDVLYCCFAQQLVPDTEAISRRFRVLDSVLIDLTAKERDRVIDLACQLCSEHQQIAFRQGVLTGFHLSRELNEQT